MVVFHPPILLNYFASLLLYIILGKITYIIKLEVVEWKSALTKPQPTWIKISFLTRLIAIISSVNHHDIVTNNNQITFEVICISNSAIISS